jgi:hypothetical protein
VDLCCWPGLLGVLPGPGVAVFGGGRISSTVGRSSDRPCRWGSWSMLFVEHGPFPLNTVNEGKGGNEKKKEA